jgi:hypothetical protein
MHPIIIPIFIVIAIATALAATFLLRARRRSQLEFIRSYNFHPAIREKVARRYSHLNDNQINTLFDALRDYFTFCNRAKRRMVAMPSQAVDTAWHEFILFTRAYKLFSKRAIGRYLHHTPTVAMSTPTQAHESIKRAWRLACAKEGIDPANPARLPLLFAIDAMYGIEDGFVYSLDCRDKSSPNDGSDYCAGHIACAGGCAGDSGAGDDFSSGSDCGGSSCCGGGSSCGGD